MSLKLPLGELPKVIEPLLVKPILVGLARLMAAVTEIGPLLLSPICSVPAAILSSSTSESSRLTVALLSLVEPTLIGVLSVSGRRVTVLPCASSEKVAAVLKAIRLAINVVCGHCGGIETSAFRHGRDGNDL